MIVLIWPRKNGHLRSAEVELTSQASMLTEVVRPFFGLLAVVMGTARSGTDILRVSSPVLCRLLRGPPFRVLFDHVVIKESVSSPCGLLDIQLVNSRLHQHRAYVVRLVFVQMCK